MGPEGSLRVGLRLAAGRIGPVSVRSTRPDIARMMLLGRSAAGVQAAVPLLFSVCARSQATASRLACAAAAGSALSASDSAEAQAEIAAETVREFAWQALLNAARWLGEAPAPGAVAAARAATGYRWAAAAGGAPLAIALAAFGRPAGDWLQLDSWPALQAWAADGDTATARHIHGLRRPGPPRAGCDACTPRLPRPAVDWLLPLAAAMAADAGFAQQPTWRGAAAETGAFARRQDDPLFDPAGAATGLRTLDRSALRFVARLRELARLLDGQADPSGPVSLGALALDKGCGLAWVESPRGLLLHQVCLSEGRVCSYRIVAPTEWNFHPRGALVAALEGAQVDGEASALALATRVANSLDPCVPCRVEVEVDGA